MDLIGSLSHQLGVDTKQAEGVAGGLLGAVKESVQQKLGGESAQQLDAAVPELKTWGAANPAGSVSTGGGIGSWLGGGAGPGGLGGALGAIAPLAGKLGLGPDKLAATLPLVMGFLRARLDPALLGKIAGAVPFLSHAGGGQPGGGGGLGDAIGGLFGKS